MKTQIFSKHRRSFILASAGAMLTPEVLYSAPSQYGIVGQQAPELKVSKWIDPKGKPTTFQLSDHKGKFVFMEFWQAWCPGCHSHGLPALKEIATALADNDKFVAIAIQTTFEGFSFNVAGQMRIIQKKFDLPIVMGHDAGEEGVHPYTMQSYLSGGTPWAVLISPEGNVIFNDFNINPQSAIAFIKKATTKAS